jgi:hypothetical protein
MFIVPSTAQRCRSIKSETRHRNLAVAGKSDCAPTELRSKEKTARL